MTLESVLVSRDWQEISVLECILGSLQISVDVESDPARAHTKLSKSKVDAVIIDRDLHGSADLATKVRSTRCNGNSIPLILLSGSPERHNLPATGATFFFEKPISVEQAVRTLSAARNMILDSRLRYHRHLLDVPVSLRFGGEKKLNVHLLNLSQGGIGIRTMQPINANGPISVSFQLPGARSSVQAKGELAWTDANGNAGIRFLHVPEHQQRTMQLWLEKQYFAQ
ncbi:MAG TPA: PilZ domain-containing protein [Terriglobales bacterium]|jgi:CheY-like chemotaxis protein